MFLSISSSSSYCSSCSCPSCCFSSCCCCSSSSFSSTCSSGFYIFPKYNLLTFSATLANPSVRIPKMDLQTRCQIVRASWEKWSIKRIYKSRYKGCRAELWICFCAQPKKWTDKISMNILRWPLLGIKLDIVTSVGEKVHGRGLSIHIDRIYRLLRPTFKASRICRACCQISQPLGSIKINYLPIRHTFYFFFFSSVGRCKSWKCWIGSTRFNIC